MVGRLDESCVRRLVCIAVAGGLATALLILACSGRADGATFQSFETERMKAPAGKIFKSPGASAGKGIMLTRPSWALKKVVLPETAERVSVRARAGKCEGAPTMAVKVGAKTAMVRRVSLTGWRYYSADVSVPKGTHMVKISFRGKRGAPGCRRNLQLDKVMFEAAPASAPAPKPVPEPELVPDLKPDCENSLQGMIDDAGRGDVVQTPGGCIFREKVIVDKPLTLRAGPGAEIRGSDVWENWEMVGGSWRSYKTYPKLSVQDRWRCEEGTDRCHRPEQVYIGGEELALTEGEPKVGEFALDEQRRILLADDPRGKAVEVTVRNRWVAGASSDVTIEGFTMRHSANEGIKNDLEGRWTVRDNDLSYAHTVNLELSKGPGMVAEGNSLHHAGQMGFASNEAEITLTGNEIAYNNTKGFDPGWEAGAMKISQTPDARIEGNHVHHNRDFGIWTDIIQDGAQRVEIVDNRIHHHGRQGIRVEITKNVLVEDNVVYENGLEHKGDPNSGAGIGISGSHSVEARGNVLAYNRNGFVVVNADRPPYDHVDDVRLEDNIVVQNSGKAMGWYKAVENGNIYDGSAGNGGAGNRYWYPGGKSSEGGAIRFKWSAEYNRLADYMDRGPETNSRYLSNGEKETTLREKGIPAKP